MKAKPIRVSGDFTSVEIIGSFSKIDAQKAARLVRKKAGCSCKVVDFIEDRFSRQTKDGKYHLFVNESMSEQDAIALAVTLNRLFVDNGDIGLAR